MKNRQRTILQIISSFIFLSGWTIGIVFVNDWFLIPLYLLSVLSLFAIPFYVIYNHRKEDRTSTSIFIAYIFIPFVLMIPCAYGIGTVNNWLFEITGQKVSAALEEHKAAIDPFDPGDAKRFITNAHILFSVQLNQLYYSDDSGMGHKLSRSYTLLGAFPWMGDYVWEGNKWVAYNPYANQNKKSK